MATGNPLVRTKTDRQTLRRLPTAKPHSGRGSATEPPMSLPPIPVGASSLAKIANDDAGIQDTHSALEVFASELAPTGIRGWNKGGSGEKSRSVTTKSSLAKSQIAPIYTTLAT
ncbi:hypothetical protein BZ164_04415 [Pseudomonas veronii]|nr:hypothetical protein BZ164_04415 [Pseudomonas veronii]